MIDPHSYANFHEVIVIHYALNLQTDFNRKIFYGYVDVTAKVIGDHVECLCLDIKALAIERITFNNVVLEWTIPKANRLGSLLSISVPEKHRALGSEFTIRIRYSTTPESNAIQWLEPFQTAGKIYPCCYTQCEAILARTLLPCQDTPKVKAPYTIEIACPAPLMAVCSGIPEEDNPSAGNTYFYRQSNPIPAYLIAIVVGKLEKGRIGPRSTVYTEKELLSRAIYEFSQDTENYIRAGEEITGVKYDWGVYDMVVLPSAFPYGGMENPNLTFLSSSLLAGDRSLTNVVVHEISHSWSGNYVTNASWSDFWLNEGFTVYLERMILGKITQSVQYRHFEMLCGYNDLKKTINDLENSSEFTRKDKPDSGHPELEFTREDKPDSGHPELEFTKLCPDLTGIDPDDAFSKIPYEKGSLFLFFLETKVGGEYAMQKWLNSYFTTFRNKSLTTSQMKEHFLNHFAHIDLSSVDWDTWLYSPGLPSFNPESILDNTLTLGCKLLAEKWLYDKGQQATEDDLKDFRSKQVMFFLDEIINGGGIDEEVLEHMDMVYGLSKSPNVEIQFRWLQLGLKCNASFVIPQASDFLSKHGRGLYVKPLYKLLHKVDRASAITIYRNNRPYYHSVIRNAFDGLLS